MPRTNPHLWQEAASFAARAHIHQIRKDRATPYIAHPFRVAMTIQHVFGCEDEAAICAGLLHDTIEDTTTDYDDLIAHFGAAVADLVAAMTKNMALPEEQREHDYDKRLAAADWRARLVKLADVYDNLCDSRGLEASSAAKLPEKIKRAITLATRDCAAHPETDRAIQALRRIAGTV
jgi:guanosine-3',5'-bis(diphosphate) 3'-pyrophosphohydrolase